jgi:hypothetical protein
MEFLRSLEKSPVGAWVRESEWGYAIVLCAHAVGMAIVVGVLVMINLRVLGYGRGVGLGQLKKLSGIAWVGFGINAVSGVMLFAGNARRLAETFAFQVKLVLLVAGGYAVWLLWRTLNAAPETLEPGVAATTERARVIAIVSLVVWLGVILAGRIIGYTINFEPLP